MNGSSERPQQLFTVDEADALLPQIIPLLEQLQGLQRSIIETSRKLDELAGRLAGGNGYPLQTLHEQMRDLTVHQLQLIEAFRSAIKQFEELGGVLKDLGRGLVDFYSLRGAEVVCLCWKLGEERILFWHTLEAGFTGRQPLDETDRDT